MRANLKSCNLLGKAGERLNVTTSMESLERAAAVPKRLQHCFKSPSHGEYWRCDSKCHLAPSAHFTPIIHPSAPTFVPCCMGSAAEQAPLLQHHLLPFYPYGVATTYSARGFL